MLSCLLATKEFYEALLALSEYMETKANEEMSHKEEYSDDVAFLDGNITELEKEIHGRTWYGRLLCFS